jgi:carbonic anhydrase
MGTLEGQQYSRRAALRLLGAAATGLSLAHWFPAIAASDQNGRISLDTSQSDRPGPDEALQLLSEGNQRWVAGTPSQPNQSAERRAQVAGGQTPWVVVFSCIDSRVPPELVFDRGLGDMFVVRTAGHVMDSAALGSIQFGVEEIHVPLVVVLGHERCGAVIASLEAVEHDATAPGQINALVEGIRPAIAAASHDGDVTDNVVRAHTVLTVNAVRADPLIAEAISHGAVRVVGARYDLDTGIVDWIA